jgi:hypothetical protein
MRDGLREKNVCLRNFAIRLAEIKPKHVREAITVKSFMSCLYSISRILSLQDGIIIRSMFPLIFLCLLVKDFIQPAPVLPNLIEQPEMKAILRLSFFSNRRRLYGNWAFTVA